MAVLFLLSSPFLPITIGHSKAAELSGNSDVYTYRKRGGGNVFTVKMDVGNS